MLFFVDCNGGFGFNLRDLVEGFEVFLDQGFGFGLGLGLGFHGAFELDDFLYHKLQILRTGGLNKYL